MAFRQIISSAKTNRIEPYVSVLASGIVFNPAAAEEAGEHNERVVVFYEKETNRLAFIFMKAKISGSYSFRAVTRSKSKRIGIAKFLKKNRIIERAHGSEFPLQILKETMPDYEGSTIFFLDLDKKADHN